MLQGEAAHPGRDGSNKSERSDRCVEAKVLSWGEMRLKASFVGGGYDLAHAGEMMVPLFW